MALCPVYQYLKDSGIETEGSLLTSVEIGDKSSVPPGTGRLFKFGSIPGIITCTKDGEYHAFSAICTHLGCTVQFRDDKQEIWCACHGDCYDAATVVGGHLSLYNETIRNVVPLVNAVKIDF